MITFGIGPARNKAGGATGMGGEFKLFEQWGRRVGLLTGSIQNPQNLIEIALIKDRTQFLNCQEYYFKQRVEQRAARYGVYSVFGFLSGLKHQQAFSKIVKEAAGIALQPGGVPGILRAIVNLEIVQYFGPTVGCPYALRRCP